MAPSALRAIEELRTQLSASQIVTANDRKAGYQVDWTGRYAGAASAVVHPTSTSEVAEIVNICRRHAVPIITQGGNTGLVGGAVPNPASDAGIIVSTKKLGRGPEIDVLSSQATCGAGVTIAQLQEAANEHGLKYGVDFAARDSATIGGTLATNAGGHNVVAYGTTRAQILGLEAVLADGSIISRLDGLEKDNTGYALKDVLIGSEGTLGIITATRVRLIPRAAHVITALLSMASVEACVHAVADLRKSSPSPTAIEFMTADGVALVAERTGLGSPPISAGQAMLLVELEGTEQEQLIDALSQNITALTGTVDTAVATSSIERSRLWQYRDRHSDAVATLGVPHKLDVALPLTRIAAFINALPTLTAPHQVVTWGHLGDGNLHVNIIGPDLDDHQTSNAVLAAVVEAGGSISGEHGIGVAKHAALLANRSTADLNAMRAIKAALDPTGLLNPGVLLPID